MIKQQNPGRVAFVAVVLLTAFTATNALGQDDEPRSPFSEVRWDDAGLPVVKVDNQWYSLRSINGVSVNEILNFCKETWPRKVKKRFEEDLVEVLSGMGKPPEATVELGVVGLNSNKTLTMSDVPMTKENRERVWGNANWDRIADGRYAFRIFDSNKDGKFEEHEVPHKMWEKITRYDINKDGVTIQEFNHFLKDIAESESTISAEQALADIDDFQRQLEERFAYLKANNVDYINAIKRIRSRVKSPMNIGDLESEVGLVISMFIDGHAGPGGRNINERTNTRLPFLLETAGDRFVAVNVDRDSLVDANHPYIVSMDGVDLERWLASMEPYVCKGSPQWVRRRSARYLRDLGFARKQLGLPESDHLVVELTSENGTSRITKSLSTKTTLKQADTPERECKILDGNIGYLSLPTFSGRPNAVERIKLWMPRFRDTKGLIVDVRDNGGGSREALLELFPYLLEVGEARVGNICAYRTYEEFDDDHLEARFAYRESDQRWDKNEKSAIRDFKKNFKPEWETPSGDFSDWHYLVLSKRAGDPRYHYNKPVVLLTNSGCFSATDIFVGAFKGFRQVTIMGQSTGGGSARSQTERLPNSGVRIQLASMASFQPNGLLYDGRGIAVDVVVDPRPETFLNRGSDNVIQAALEFIEKLNE